MKETQHSKMRWLWENMKGYRALYFVGIMGTLVYNVMQLIVPYITQMIVDTFLTTDFSGDQRHQRRIDMITAIEQNQTI